TANAADVPPSIAGLAVTAASAGSVQFVFRTNVGSEVEVRLFGGWGVPVRTLFHGFLAAGPHALAWDGRRDQGTAAPAGQYRLVVTARTAGSAPAIADTRVRLYR